MNQNIWPHAFFSSFLQYVNKYKQQQHKQDFYQYLQILSQWHTNKVISVWKYTRWKKRWISSQSKLKNQMIFTSDSERHTGIHSCFHENCIHSNITNKAGDKQMDVRLFFGPKNTLKYFFLKLVCIISSLVLILNYQTLNVQQGAFFALTIFS